MKRIPHRIFTEEFKCEAIKLVLEQGLTLAKGLRSPRIKTGMLQHVPRSA